MYQTVGQDAIEFVARALEVPLYRHVIQGDAIEQNAEYGSRIAGGAGVLGDETEDLYTLLKRVKVRSNSRQLISPWSHSKPGSPPGCARCLSRRYSLKLPTRSRRTCVRIGHV